MIGNKLSGYEILELAGSGGMGRVFRARDQRLGRQVAVKVLHPRKNSDEGLRRRLLREARAYAMLKHPGVVSIYTVGHDQGMDFIAMEWVPGRTLAEVLAAGEVPVERVVNLALQLADALAAVHGAGIIHRDLKPQNILVEGEKVTLLDFGIAKFEGGIDAVTLNAHDTTREGMAPGTVAYMAPEQALGEGVDRRSDVFSFGILLYEMLAGHRPFQGETMPAMVRQLLFAAPMPLPGSRVPEALQTVVLKALAKKPQDRYQGMESLAQDLQNFGRIPPSPGRAEPLEPSSVTAKAPKSRTRRGTAALLVALVAVGASFAFFGRRGASEGVVEHARLEEPAVELPRTPFALYKVGQQHLVRFDQEASINEAIKLFEAAVTQSPDYAPAHLGLATAYWRMFRRKRERGWLERAAQSARRAQELDPLLTSTGILLARIQTSEGMLTAAKATLLRIHELDPNQAEALVGLGEIAQLEGNPTAAAPYFAEATTLEPGNWEFHSLLGGIQRATGDVKAAEASFRKSLDLMPDTAIVRRNLGAVLHDQGRYGEAITEFQRSITIQPTGSAYSNLGTAYFFQGAYPEAAAAFEGARELGANHYLLWSNLGDAYRQIPGKGDAALLCFERAIQLLSASITSSNIDPTLQSRMALYLVKANRPTEALARLKKIEPLSQDTPGIAAIAYRATVVHELAGQRQPALRSLEVALEGGYPTIEILRDPELIGLREAVAFHELMVRFDSETVN